MIFGRRKRAEREDPATTADVESGDGAGSEGGVEIGDETAGDETGESEDGTAPSPDPDVEPELDLAALDGAQWRDDGPFEIGELHESDPDEADGEDGDADEQPRIDLGSIILTGVPGSELRLQVTEDTEEIVSAMLILPDAEPDADGAAAPGPLSSSALELSAFAAPRSGGLWQELRDEIAEAAIDAGGSASLGEGPFGVELRRLVPVTTPEGEQGYQPSRMWVAEGPRWMLRGIVYGSAAIEEDLDAPTVVAVIAAFRAVVVRRGDEAMAPGDLLPFTMPGDLTPAT